MIEVEELKATNPNDPRIVELTNDAKNWQTGGLLLDSVAGILSGPNTNGAIGTFANAGKPWIAAEIGNYFKDKDKVGSKEHILAHTILGGAIAAATGNDALSGGLAAGGAEALAPAVSSFLYGNKKPEELTADEKQTIGSIISLGGAGVGALVGGSGSDAVSSGQLAGNAVDNNAHFRKGQREQRKSEIKACGDSISCQYRVEEKYSRIVVENARDLYSTCSKNGTASASCSEKRESIDQSSWQGRQDYKNPTEGFNVPIEVGGTAAAGLQINATGAFKLGKKGLSLEGFEGGGGLGFGMKIHAGLFNSTGTANDPKTSLNHNLEWAKEGKIGTNQRPDTVSVGSKIIIEGDAGPLHGELSGKAGWDGKVDGRGNTQGYVGGDGKAAIRPQIGGGGSVRWDAINFKYKKNKVL